MYFTLEAADGYAILRVCYLVNEGSMIYTPSSYRLRFCLLFFNQQLRKLYKKRRPTVKPHNFAVEISHTISKNYKRLDPTVVVTTHAERKVVGYPGVLISLEETMQIYMDHTLLYYVQ